MTESTLKTLSAAFAQWLLRHKSQKKEFRVGFWFTVIVNSGALFWLLSPDGNNLLSIIQ
jgi:uncharacterized membrane protein YsdA (DUF1294 family)